MDEGHVSRTRGLIELPLTELLMSMHVFPKWVNLLKPGLAVGLIGGPIYALGVFALAASPRTTDVGYQPAQPVPYSHAVHVDQLGLDCRYCHNTVEWAAHAAIPPTQTCMNCHAGILPDSEKLRAVRRSYETGLPVEWVRVHDLPDYVYFNHSAHVQRGIGCVSCHGRVDKMETVYQVHTLSMGWCLACHRNPEPHLRPRDKIFDLAFDPANMKETERQAMIQSYNVNPSTDCSTCHR